MRWEAAQRAIHHLETQYIICGCKMRIVALLRFLTFAGVHLNVLIFLYAKCEFELCIVRWDCNCLLWIAMCIRFVHSARSETVLCVAAYVMGQCHVYFVMCFVSLISFKKKDCTVYVSVFFFCAVFSRYMLLAMFFGFKIIALNHLGWKY